VRITYDPVKRAAAFAARGLDFEAAAEVFAGARIDIPDLRRDYGEPRIQTVGYLRGRMVVVDEREKARYRDRLAPRG
jgi:uncharacterized DUF497 family protein